MEFEEYNIEIEVDSLSRVLLPKLNGKIFHVTTWESYQKILKDKNIIVNPVGVPKWANYKKAYGSDRNLVCLFDLRDVGMKQIEDAIEKINFLNRPHCDETPVYIFFKDTIITNLIPWTKAENEVGYKEQWVPHVEVWYPSPLSIEHINYVLKVDVILDENYLRRKAFSKCLEERIGRTDTIKDD